MKTTEFYPKKQKTMQLIIYAGVACVLLLGCIIYSAGFFNQELKVKPLVISGALFLIMIALLIGKLRSLSDKSPLITLNDETFEGRTTPLGKAFGKGEWADVETMYLQVSGGDEMLVITLPNDPKYSKRLSRIMRNIAIDKERNKIVIMYSASEIEITPKELLETFQSYYKNAIRDEGPLS